MIFRPQFSGIPLWPAECMPEGSITSVANGNKVEVVEHREEEETGKRTVLLRNTVNGSQFTISGEIRLPLLKAPPTWHP